MSTDPLADALTALKLAGSKTEIGYYFKNNETAAGIAAAWLRDPEGIAALAADETIREGIRRGSYEVLREIGFREGHEAGQRETAEKIAEAIEKIAEAIEKKAMAQPTVTSQILQVAADIARSFATEQAGTDHAHEWHRDGAPDAYRCMVPGCTERTPRAAEGTENQP